jgi:ParB family chromosome partitioning protein
MAKPALGRGLGALLGGSPAIANSVPVAPSPAITHSTTTTHAVPATVPHAVIPQPAAVSRDAVRRVPVLQVKPCAFQPRKDFPPDALRELSDSIREQGIVQPLIVRPMGNNFELIAGERRWRAAQLAGLTEVPVIVREADDRAVLELALIENLQRENLNAIEESLGYAQLVSQFQLTQELVATKVGKSRAVVANALRLLKLPSEVQNFIRDGRISVGHAKVILGLANPIQQSEAAERVIKEGLNVRQAEGLISKMQSRDTKPKASKVSLPTDAHISNLENKIREKLGTKVSLRYAKGKGSVEISFYSDAELEGVLQALGVNAD